jgi:hypothetical protein
MKRTRRGFLAVVGATSVAGCSDSSGVNYPDVADENSDNSDESTNEGTPINPDETEEDGSEEPKQIKNELLARGTRRVVADSLWFATEYKQSVQEYLEAVQKVVDKIEVEYLEVTQSAELDQSVVDQLHESGSDAANRAQEALTPHFDPQRRSRITSRTEQHTDVLDRFIDVGDIDRFLEELDRMQSSFQAIATRSFVKQAYSVNPIHNRLLYRLLYPGSTSDEDRPSVFESTQVQIGVGDEFSTFAHWPYNETSQSTDPTAIDDTYRTDQRYRPEIRARLGPVVQPADRTAELFFIFGNRPGTPQPLSEWIQQHSDAAVYVQRYPNQKTATNRLDEILAGGQTGDTEPIDPAIDETDGTDAATHWQRFYHFDATSDRYEFDTHSGVQYGYVVQAGEFILATGFTGDAWDERLGWQGRLENGWVVI